MTRLRAERQVPLGRVVATPAALALVEDLVPFLKRHETGDWGDVNDEDASANADAVRSGLRVMSAYEVAGERLLIITEADRSSTCILLQNEY